MKMKREHKREILRHLALISQIGISMLVPIVGCVLLGAFLDRTFGTKVVFLAIFTVIGVGAAFKALFDIAGKY